VQYAQSWAIVIVITLYPHSVTNGQIETHASRRKPKNEYLQILNEFTNITIEYLFDMFVKKSV
jgi:hypothetical protein